MTHFVYVYASQGVLWEELYRSIQSVHKFFQGSKKIFVVGDKPNVRGVIHIKHDRTVNVPHPKAADSIAKLKMIVADDRINEEFVYMHDDMIILKPCKEADFRVVRANDLCVSPGLYFTKQSKQSSKWKSFFMRSMTVLKRNGYPMWNYETHTPRWFNKTRVTEVIEKYGMDKPTDKAQVLFASMYYNTYFKEPQQVLTKNLNIKAGVYEPHEKMWLEKNISGKLFLNYDNTGLNNHLKTFIRHLLKL